MITVMITGSVGRAGRAADFESVQDLALLPHGHRAAMMSARLSQEDQSTCHLLRDATLATRSYNESFIKSIDDYLSTQCGGCGHQGCSFKGSV